MDATEAYKFIGFGAMDATKAYKFIGFGAMEASKVELHPRTIFEVSIGPSG